METFSNTGSFEGMERYYCFFCLSEVSPSQSQLLTSIKVDPYAEPEPLFHVKYSLQYLSHYLKLDVRGAVLDDKEIRASQPQPSQQSPNVTLCEGCQCLSGRFSELYQQLERIQMEVTACLETIRGKLLLQAKKTPSPSTSSGQLQGQQEMERLRPLRKAAIQKCLSKLKQATPRVEIERLTTVPTTATLIMEGDSDLDGLPQLDIDIHTADMSGSESSHSNQELNEFPLESNNATDDPNASTDADADAIESARLPKRNVGKLKMRFEKNPNTGKFKCSSCDKEFTAAGSTLKHYRRIHLKLKRADCTCPICGEQFHGKRYLKSHHRTIHLKNKPHQCSECDMGFSRRRQLQNHRQRVHLKIKPHQCDLCGMQFSLLTSLQSHRRIVHLNIRPYQCDECGKQFPGRALLKTHQEAVHLKLKPYKCDQDNCGKQFSSKRHLERHNQIVHLKLPRPKKYQCDICGKQVLHHGLLTLHHEFVHLNVKRYQCSHCGKGFCAQRELTAHVESVHLKIRHDCDQCGKQFTTKRCLRRHRKEVHPEPECDPRAAEVV